MQPSSDQGSGSDRSSALRRFGPVIAIVVVIAIVAVVVVVGGGGGDDDGDTAAGPASGSTPGEGPEEAISWTEAQEGDLDVTFPDTCDPETGQVAIPYYFAAECFANVEDNGGATSPGVTGDTVTIVFYSSPAEDPVLDYITGPIANDDTPEEIAETVENYFAMFNDYYQTYGRTVEFEVLEASGISTDEVAARADAQRAAEMDPFAVIGGPTLTNAWTDEIAANGIVCIACPGGTQEFLEDRAPYVYTITPGGAQTNIHAAEFISKKLADGPAEFAGDPAFQDSERSFAHLYIRSSEESDALAEDFAERLSEGGVELAEQIDYELDPGRLPEQATTIIARLKAAGVTTILLQADPIAPSNFTQEATAQEYFPEWVVAGGTLVDTTVFGRVYDQQQWANAFGIANLTSVRLPPEESAARTLHLWYTGEEPPAPDTAPVELGNPSLTFSAIQAAGPNLTPETFRDGLFAGEIEETALTAPSVNYGNQGLWPFTDWNGIDDATAIWWDPDVEGPDEIQNEGTGMYRYVDGGERYYPDDWPEELKAFDEEGTETILDSAPPEETPPDYPSPAEGG